MRSSQGQRSSSVSGWPDFILARAASVCRSSPSMNSAVRALARRTPTVVLPEPETPITTIAKLSEAGGDAAVDIEDVAIDETRSVGAKEDRGADQLFDVAPAAHRRAACEPGRELLVLDQRLVEFGGEIAGRDRVDAQPVLAPIGRHALGEHLHRALGGGVGGDIGAREFALHRADVDDAAFLARDHRPGDSLAYVENTVEIGAHQFAPSLLRVV